MSNVEALNISQADLQTKLNPSYIPDGVHVIAYATPTISGIDTSTVTCASVTWPIDRLAGLHALSASGVIRQITSNTSDTLTIAGDTADLGIDVDDEITITGWPLLWDDDQWAEERGQAVSRVLSALPERYHRMMRRIEGSIIVRRATRGQITASTAFAPISEIEVFKNGARLESTEYTIDDRAVTFATALAVDDQIVINYDHSLTTDTDGLIPRVPTILKTHALNLLAHSAAVSRWGGRVEDNFPEALKLQYDQTVESLDALRKENEPWGIDEFDAINLLVETRANVSPTYGSPVYFRG